MELRTEAITVRWDKEGTAHFSFSDDKPHLGWNISEMGLMLETRHLQTIHPWHRIRNIEISKSPEGTVTDRTYSKKPNVEELPKAECKFGYPLPQVLSIIGEEKEIDFFEFMRSQTMSECSGEVYDAKKGEYIPTNCGPHGIAVHTVDVIKFIKGLPVTD